MLNFIVKIATTPLYIADATLRAAGKVAEEVTGEKIINGKTFIAKAADEFERAIDERA